jgi:hypothetical protein
LLINGSILLTIFLGFLGLGWLLDD